MTYAVIAEGLVKRYVTRKRLGLIKSVKEVVEALRGISFKVRFGEVVGLLGPNGAGKTTTIKILATLLIPDEGHASVCDYDVVKEVSKVRELIGVMLNVEKGFYGKLTGEENLRYFASLYGLPRNEIKRRVKELIELLELDRLGATHKLYEEFSLGMKARLAFARALLRDPPVLLLDEPTLGLDPPSARKIRELVKELARKEGKAVFYTTHNMFEAEIVCDRILLINHGRIIAEGTPDYLKSLLPSIKPITVKLAHHGEIKEALTELRSRLGTDVRVLEAEDNYVILKVLTKKPEELLNDLLNTLIRLNCKVLSLKIEEPTLEDVFIKLTGDSSEGT